MYSWDLPSHRLPDRSLREFLFLLSFGSWRSSIKSGYLHSKLLQSCRIGGDVGAATRNQISSFEVGNGDQISEFQKKFALMIDRHICDHRRTRLPSTGSNQSRVLHAACIRAYAPIRIPTSVRKIVPTFPPKSGLRST